MDYPGLGVGTDAIYITGNLYSFAGGYYQSRLYIVPKGLGTGGFYDGGTATANRYNPYFDPERVRHDLAAGAARRRAAANPIGTWLVGYNRLNDGTNAYLQVIRVDSATTTPVFTLAQINMGTIDSLSTGFPGVPQSGTWQHARRWRPARPGGVLVERLAVDDVRPDPAIGRERRDR
jgi:hypothetical protein